MAKFYYYNDSGVYALSLSLKNTHIENSFKLRSIKDMKDCLIWGREYTDFEDPFAINKRSLFSMITEWRAHNLLYNLHIQRDRTRSVDLEYPIKWYKQVAYFILSCFYLRF